MPKRTRVTTPHGDTGDLFMVLHPKYNYSFAVYFFNFEIFLNANIE